MKDRRLPPFVWQSRAAMGMVRHCFAGRERTTAVALYQTMTQLANDERADSFTAPRKLIADLAGVSDRTVDRYVDAFERVSLLEVERRVGDGGNQASTYTLIEPPAASPPPSEATSPRVPKPDRHPGEATSHPTREGEEEQQERGEESSSAGTSPAAGDQLFEAPVEATAPDPLDTQAEDIWTHYATVFGDRLRVKELTPPRRRTLRKALGAVAGDVQLCKRAIDGLQSYRKKNPQGSQDVSLSVVFETGPQSRSSLTDQIEWWASQADARTTGAGLKVPLDLSGVPSVSAGTIRVRREWARRKFEEPDNEYVQQQGEAALTWLREHCGHAPVFTDGRITGWQAVEA